MLTDTNDSLFMANFIGVIGMQGYVLSVLTIGLIICCHDKREENAKAIRTMGVVFSCGPNIATC
jgi:hypothetical protein